MPDEISIEFDVPTMNATIGYLGKMKDFAKGPYLLEAMEAWCKLIETEAKKLCRVKTGALRETIRHMVAQEAAQVVGKVMAGETGKKSAAIARWMHYGTRGHMVFPVRARALHWRDESTGESRFSKGHYVRGVTPDYFLLTAFNNKLEDGKQLMAEAWRKHMEASRR